MKMKFKFLASAVALAMASATASAAINTSTTPDLLLIAYDAFSGDTYTRDLGVSLSALSTSRTFAAPTGSIFASQFASATHPIQWNVIAATYAMGAYAMYFTGDITTTAGIVPSNVSDATSQLTNSLGSFTQLDNPTNGYAKANGEYTGSTNPNDVTNGATMAQTASFGFPVSGNGIGTSQNLLKVNTDGSATQLFTNASLSAFNNNARGGYFTLLDAQGDLKWTTADVAAVPLPPAALLFAPGLLAMFGLGRRNKKLA